VNEENEKPALDPLIAAPNSNKKITNEELKKYSYLLNFMGTGEKIGYTDGGATGFFIKHNNHTYLVSNYHVFTNQNTMTKRQNKERYDSIGIAFAMNDDFMWYAIDVREIVKNSKSYYYYEYPDVYVYPIDDIVNYFRVNYINEFVDSIPNNVTPDEVIIYGYPEDTKEPSLLLSQMTANFYDTVDFYDKGHLHMLHNTYFTKPASRGGYSGSPVFLRFKEKVVFGGILSSHTPKAVGTEEGVSFIIKPFEIFTRIK
jgi:hypothetical protein